MKTTSLLTVGTVSVVSLLASSARANDFPTASVVDGVGVNANYEEFADPAFANKLQAAGARVVRVQFPAWIDTGTDFVFQAFENVILACANAELRVYAVLGSPPKEYCGDVSDCYGTSLFRCRFNNFVINTVKELRAYATTLRLPDDYFTWELWNEPNFGFSSAADYMYLAMGTHSDADEDNSAACDTIGLNYVNPHYPLKGHYTDGALKIIRDADPHATIIAPAIATKVGRNEFLSQCVIGGLLDKIDGVSVHLYRNPYRGYNLEGVLEEFFNPEGVVDEYSVNGKVTLDGSEYSGVANLMGTEYGNFPIISGEWGYETSPDPMKLKQVTRQVQADYLQRMMLTNFSAMGVDGVTPRVPISVWFEGKDNPPNDFYYGLLDTSGKPKPSFYAMKTLTSNLKGARFGHHYPTSDTDFLMLFYTPRWGGQKAMLAAWTTAPSGLSAMEEDYDGWGRFLMTATPLYLGTPLVWNGNSSWTWGFGEGWPDDFANHSDNWQAKFTQPGTVYVDKYENHDHYLSGLQFEADSVYIRPDPQLGGRLRFTPGSGNLYVGNDASHCYFDSIYAELADTYDRGTEPLLTSHPELDASLAYTNTPETFVLRKSGCGGIGLNGYNTFHGSVLAYAGYLNLGNDHALGDERNPVTLAGGGIDFNSFSPNMKGDFLVSSSGLPIGNWCSSTFSRYTFPSGTIADNATLTVGGGGNFELAGPISGAGGLNKIDSGALTLSGNNTFSGWTSISQSSTLYLSGSGSINDSGKVIVRGALYQNSSVPLSVPIISIYPGATFGGTGVRDRDLRIMNGHLSPGESAGQSGTLTVAGNLVFGSSGSLEVDITSTSSHDKVDMSGAGRVTVTLAGTVNVYYRGTGTIATGSYPLISGFAGSTGTMTLGSVPPGRSYNLRVSGGSLVLDVT